MSAGLSTVKRGGLEETTNSIGLNKFSQFTSEGLGVNKLLGVRSWLLESWEQTSFWE
jgi:hypothetical protein